MTHDPFLSGLRTLGGLAGTSTTDSEGWTTVRLSPGPGYPDVIGTRYGERGEHLTRDVRVQDAGDTGSYGVLTVDERGDGLAVRSAMMIQGQVRANPPRARYDGRTEHVTRNDQITALTVTYDRDWWMNWAHLITGLHALRAETPAGGDPRLRLLDLLRLDPHDCPRREQDQARIQAARDAVQAGLAPDEPLAFAAFYASLNPAADA